MQWRTPITLIVLVGILMGAAWYGWQTIVDPVTDAGSPSTTQGTPHTPHDSHPTQPSVCLKKKTYLKGTTIRDSSFKVNVFNAGDVSGKAGAVLTALRSKGFRQGIASNPPSGVTATNVTILTSDPNAPQVQLVKRQFRGTVKLEPGPNLAVGVDVVIGNGFVGTLTSAPSEITLTANTTVCVSYKGDSAG